MSASSLPIRRTVSVSVVISLVVGALMAVALAAASPAAAVLPSPPAMSEPTPNNVTADALPTVQIDGVVWSQAIVGNTVYAGGNFANARPAGAAAGTNLTPRTDLLSYDLSTGVLNTSFAPTLNGQVKTVVASPDGSRIYVGGEFTSVNGVNRYRVAAFSTATGDLITSFAPALNYTLDAIVATNDTVYLGGPFSTVGGVARSRLAAVSAANGALLAWNPSADYTVTNMVMTPSGSKLIVGGAFQYINGSPAYGLGALDPVTGALVPWAAGNTVRDAGSSAAIDSLSTDGTAIYGAGYVFGPGGNLEGTFSADPESGNINWIEDCHGDTYGAYGMNGVVYTISHAHYCSPVGGYPQTDANWQINEHHALAFTADVRGTLGHNTYSNYPDWFGTPAPSMYNWFPDFTVGTFTGIGQAAWTVTGNGKYVIMGGEFLGVNFTGTQQGLVRFAPRPTAPAKQFPRVSGANFVPTVAATSSRSVRVTWQANWDRDSQNLTYKVIRNNNSGAPVYTTTAVSQFWNRPSLGFTDLGLSPGTTYTYKVYAIDPDGNTTLGNNVSVTTPTSGVLGPYAQQVLNDSPSNYWRLGEASGSTGVDSASGNNLVEGSGVGHGATGAVVGDSDTASTFNGTSSGTAGSTSSLAGPNVFSLEAFVKTTTFSGGKIVGFGAAQSGSSSSYDRHIYMDNSGRIFFGVYPGAVRTVNSSGSYRDGKWHHIVASLSSAGMALYVDGARVGFDASVTAAQVYTGYWRVGGDNLSAWPSAPSRNNLSGSIDDVAVYPVALTAAQVLAHYRAASGVPNQAPVAAFTPSCTNLTCSFDASASSDPDGSVVGYTWDFGDGTSASGQTANRTYGAGGTYTVTLTVTDNQGGTNAISHVVTVSAANRPPVAAFTPTCANRACSFDGSASSDPDGSISGYAWNFGDGTTGSGQTTSHTYGSDGSYTVTLTVTDNRGSTNATSRAVSVSANVAAADAFGRTFTNGWGTADIGGAWAVGGVAASNYSVSGGTASIQMGAGALPSAYLNGVSASDTDSLVDFSFDKLQTGTSATYTYLVARHAGASQYRLRAKVLNTGSVQLALTKVLSGMETILFTPPTSSGTFTAGQYLRMRLRVSGTSSVALAGKIWSVGSAEPGAWQVTVNDATNPLPAGGPGLVSYLSTATTNPPVLATFQNFAVNTVTGP